MSSQTQAITLDQALAAAYDYNPRIDAERARLRATDEDVAIAKSGLRPDINAEGSLGSRFTNSRVDTNLVSINNQDFYNNIVRPRTMGISLTQPVFRGFSVLNAVNQAEAGVRAGRETLRGVEQEVLLEAVRNYMDVVRDMAVVRLREGNVKYLSEQLKATQDRFAVGEVTKTDVAQSQARRAGALSDLDLAKANLQSSRANYVRTIGASPDGLVEPIVKENILPKSLNEAVNVGTQENPSVVGALYREQAARYKVDVVRGKLLPQIDFESNYLHNSGANYGVPEGENISVGGRMSIPIYQEGGRFHAEVRKAKHEHLSFLQEIEAARTEVKS
ncbi:MAG: TolC family protein, partial [Hyphomicrobium sp.]